MLWFVNCSIELKLLICTAPLCFHILLYVILKCVSFLNKKIQIASWNAYCLFMGWFILIHTKLTYIHVLVVQWNLIIRLDITCNKTPVTRWFHWSQLNLSVRRFHPDILRNLIHVLYNMYNKLISMVPMSLLKIMKFYCIVHLIFITYMYIIHSDHLSDHLLSSSVVLEETTLTVETRYKENWYSKISVITTVFSGPNEIISFVLYCLLTIDITKISGITTFPGPKDLIISSFHCITDICFADIYFRFMKLVLWRKAYMKKLSIHIQSFTVEPCYKEVVYNKTLL